MDIKNIVAFCILMENDKGILTKAPLYIKEKFEALINEESSYPESFLDSENKEKFNKWVETWIKPNLTAKQEDDMLEAERETLAEQKEIE